MKSFGSLGSFAAYLATTVVTQEIRAREGLEQAAQVVEAAAKAKFGDYQGGAGPFEGWQPLAEATQERRATQGYPADEPLLVTGATRDTIEHQTDGNEAHIGSNNDILLYQELGTATIPARSTLGGAAFEKAPEVVQILGREVMAGLTGGNTTTKIR